MSPVVSQIWAAMAAIDCTCESVTVPAIEPSELTWAPGRRVVAEEIVTVIVCESSPPTPSEAATITVYGPLPAAGGELNERRPVPWSIVNIPSSAPPMSEYVSVAPVGSLAVTSIRDVTPGAAVMALGELMVGG